MMFTALLVLHAMSLTSAPLRHLLSPYHPVVYAVPLQLAVDAKFTSASMMAGVAPVLASKKHEGIYGSGVRGSATGGTMYALAQSGPSHDIQPVFDWRTTALSSLNLSHVGMPDVWDFGWITVATATD